MPTKDDIDNAFNYLGVKDTDHPADKNYSYYMSKPDKVLYTNVLDALYKKYKAAEAAQTPKVLPPGTYQVN